MVNHLSSVRYELASQVWHDVVALAQSLGDNLHAQVAHRLYAVVVRYLVLVRIDVEGCSSILVLHIKQVVALAPRGDFAACIFAAATAENLSRDRGPRIVFLFNIGRIFYFIALILLASAARLR